MEETPANRKLYLGACGALGRHIGNWRKRETFDDGKAKWKPNAAW